MNQTTEAASVFAPIWRRKWLILATGLIVAVGSYFYYKRQPGEFSASTQIYLGAGAEELAHEGSAKAQGANAANQTVLINTVVSESVHKQLRLEHKKAAAKGKVKAKAAEKSEFVTITAEAKNAKSAVLLANTTAVAYIARQHATREKQINAAIEIARRQKRRLETPQKGKNKGGAAVSATSIIQAATLSSKINQLEQQLAIKEVAQVSPAKKSTAVSLAKSPKKYAIFGFMIGLVLASIAAFILSRFDRRLRSLSEIEGVFGAELLTALPTVRNPVIDEDGALRPAKPLLEPLRRLHSLLALHDSVNGSQGPPRVIMIVSADPGDGKSSLAANLALVERDAGERVCLVEANLRGPVLGRILGLDGARGLSDVLDGRLEAREAMQGIGGAVEQQASGSGGATVATRETGTISVLLSGPASSNPGALLSHASMGELLKGLAADSDHVIVDTSALLEVSDAMPLLREVDGIIIVARIGHTQRDSAERLRPLLERAHGATVLGVVATSAPESEMARHGFTMPAATQRRSRFSTRR